MALITSDTAACIELAGAIDAINDYQMQHSYLAMVHFGDAIKLSGGVIRPCQDDIVPIRAGEWRE